MQKIFSVASRRYFSSKSTQGLVQFYSTKRTKPLKTPEKLPETFLSENFTKGITFLNEKKYPQAILAFHSVNQSDSIEKLFSSYHSALANLSLEDYDAATKDFEKCVIPDEFPDSVAPLIKAISIMIPYQQGVVCIAQQRWADCIHYMDQCLEIDKKFGFAHFYRALGLFELKEYAQCLLACDEALSTDRKHVEKIVSLSSPIAVVQKWHVFFSDKEYKFFVMTALERKIYSWMELDNAQMAMQSIEEILKIDPSNTKFLLNKAVFLFTSGAYDESLQATERVLLLEPENFEAILLKVRLMTHHTGDRDEAFKLAEFGLKIQPNHPELLLVRVLVLFEAERYEESIPACDAVLAVDPSNLDAHYLRASALSWLKKFEEALPNFEAVLQGNPEHLDALYSKACCQLTLERPDDAQKTLKTLLSVDPMHERARSMLEFIASNNHEKITKTYGVQKEVNKLNEDFIRLSKKLEMTDKDRMNDFEDRENTKQFQDEMESVDEIPKRKSLKKKKSKSSKSSK